MSIEDQPEAQQGGTPGPIRSADAVFRCGPGKGVGSQPVRCLVFIFFLSIPRLVSRLLQRPASIPAPAPFLLAHHHHTHDPKPKDTHQRLHPAMPVPVRSNPSVAMSASHRRRWLVSRQSWVVSRGPWQPHTHGQTGPRTAKMHPMSKTVVLGAGGTG